MQPHLLPREKPAHQAPRIWRPSSVPLPDVAYLLPPQERLGTVLHDARSISHSLAWIGTAWRWDGSDLTITTGLGGSYIEIPHVGLADGNAAFTVSLSAYFVMSAMALSTLFGQGNSTSDNPLLMCQCTSSGGGTLVFRMRDTAGTHDVSATSSAVAAGWHHVHYVSTGTSGKLLIYVDGMDATSGGTNNTLGAVTFNRSSLFILLRAAALGSVPVNTSLRHMMAWKRALTSAEVLDHYLDPYMWLREPRRIGIPVAAAVAGNPWYAYAQQ